MKYNVLSQKVIEKIEHLIKGYRLRVSIVDTENGIMLMVSLVEYGGYAISFFTDSNYLAISRKVCNDSIVKLKIELSSYYGDETDLTFHTNGIFQDYGVFDVSKIWEELKYTPSKKYSFNKFEKYLQTLEN